MNNENKLYIQLTKKNEEAIIDYMNVLDTSYFINTLFNLVYSSYNSFVTYSVKNNTDFEVKLGYLINYLSALFTFKEYLRTAGMKYKIVSDRYYTQKESEYRFMLDYRNRVIHRFFVARHWSPENGAMYLEINELIDQLESQKKYESRNHQADINDFIQRINKIKNNTNTSKICIDNYVGQSTILARKLYDEICATTLEDNLNIIENIMDFVRNDGTRFECKNVRTASKVIPNNLNWIIENFFMDMMNNQFVRLEVKKKILDFYQKKDYSIFFNYGGYINFEQYREVLLSN